MATKLTRRVSISRIRIRQRWLAAAGATLCAFAVAAPAANAACPSDNFSSVFAAWGDTSLYRPVDGGNFETGAPGWTLSGGATIVANHSAWNLFTQNQHSLELKTGSSVTTPPICVSSGYPSSRMFAYTPTRVAASGSTLQIEVIYTDATRGGQQVKKLGTAPDELGWDATRKISIAQGQLNIKPASDGNTYIQYRFTPLYGTTWRIDDLFVDPRLRY